MNNPGGSEYFLQEYELAVKPYVDYSHYIVTARKQHYYDIICESGQRLSNVLGFTLNDTLNLSQDAEVISATTAALSTWGSAACSSVAVSGYTQPYRQLQQAIRTFKGFTYNRIFVNALMAFNALFETLCYQTAPYINSYPIKRNILIINDINNHSCIYSALRYAKNVYGPKFKQSHYSLDIKTCDIRNLTTIQKKLEHVDDSNTEIIFIADSVFSMGGNILPLPDIIEILNPYQNVRLILDSAHATGNIGETGKGILQHFNLTIEAIESMGISLVVLTTLSKFGASSGAILSCNSKPLHNLMKMSMYYMNTTSLTPAQLISGAVAIQTVLKHPEYVKALQNNVIRARTQLIKHDFVITGETHIIPLFFSKDKDLIKQIARILLEKYRIWVLPVYHVASPRIRIVINRLHTEEEIERLVQSLVEVRRALKLDQPSR